MCKCVYLRSLAIVQVQPYQYTPYTNKHSYQIKTRTQRHTHRKRLRNTLTLENINANLICFLYIYIDKHYEFFFSTATSLSQSTTEVRDPSHLLIKITKDLKYEHLTLLKPRRLPPWKLFEHPTSGNVLIWNMNKMTNNICNLFCFAFSVQFNKCKRWDLSLHQNLKCDKVRNIIVKCAQ